MLERSVTFLHIKILISPAIGCFRNVESVVQIESQKCLKSRKVYHQCLMNVTWISH